MRTVVAAGFAAQIPAPLRSSLAQGRVMIVTRRYETHVALEHFHNAGGKTPAGWQ
jgi:hypothetical protein